MTSGSGTYSDPYIIEGWDIGKMDVVGIDVENTDAYFIIRDCYIHDSGPYGIGIYFKNVRNGRILNTICTRTSVGIGLSGVQNCIISNNDCRYNFNEGIYIYTIPC